MAEPDPALIEAVRQAEARMLEIRKDPARHAELKDQQKAVQAARNALAAAKSAR
jgi:hypothetical protein